MKFLEQYWYRSDLPARFFALLLLPLSLVFCVISISRRKIYQLNIKKSYAATVPLVVIGNIVVGGSGKTPLLMSVCEFVKNNGFKPGVVSRGYGGTVKGVRQVQLDDPAALVGDEPLMICQRTGVPVVVGADRVAAVEYLLKHNQCDIVFSDDGLQHYRMQRDAEIAVVDAGRKFGNGLCLPAGPLRERVSRLDEVDMVVYSGVTKDETKDETSSYSLVPIELYHLEDGERVPLSSFTGKKVQAVAGIGHPARFFAQLRDVGIEITEHAFSDHHAYTLADFSGWQNECIVMTEKDAVKCHGLLLPDVWVLRVSAEFSEALEAELVATILPLLKRRSAQ